MTIIFIDEDGEVRRERMNAVVLFNPQGGLCTGRGEPVVSVRPKAIGGVEYVTPDGHTYRSIQIEVA